MAISALPPIAADPSFYDRVQVAQELPGHRAESVSAVRATVVAKQREVYASMPRGRANHSHSTVSSRRL